MNFEELFKKLTDNEPYPWQNDLYEKFLHGDIPNILDIPTGLGKTSVMAIWLLAFAKQLNSKQHGKIPTRLVYVVDRRVIVDQASEEAETIRSKLEKNSEIFGELVCRLNINKLRGGGGMADDREWLKHPNNPTITIGTIDMIGSRLLFSGYGLGNKIKPFYAGLIGQDSLIVLDETHLSPAMESLLNDVKKISTSTIDELLPPKILLMSATQRDNEFNKEMTLTLSENDYENKNVKKRYESTKNLELVKSDDVNKTIIEHAKKMQGSVLVYLQKPRDVKIISDELKSAKKNVVTLTGTIRGFERDNLVDNDTYKLILNNFHGDISVKSGFLISTSAGEVGADFDADHMVCDLTTLDSLIQRLGRINRSGGRVAKITIVYSDDVIKKSKKFKPMLEKTRDRLTELTKNGIYNANPRNLAKIKNKDEMFSPKPDIQPLTNDILNMWSMTSIYDKYLSRPYVTYWLHGKSEFDTPETFVAWRDDIKYIVNLDESEIESVIDSHRILPHELVRDKFKNVYDLLKKLNYRDKIILITTNGNYKSVKISDIKEEDLKFTTVLLPCSVGGLNSDGFLDAVQKDLVRDVADDIKYAKQYKPVITEKMKYGEQLQNKWNLLKRYRVLIKKEKKSDIYTQYVVEEFGKGKINEKLHDWLKDKHVRCKYIAQLPDSADEDDGEKESREIHYYVEVRQQSMQCLGEKKLDEHLCDTEKEAEKIINRLTISQNIKDAVVIAAKFHDTGKERCFWQDCMHVAENDRPLAKTKYKVKPLHMKGFRHEFASLLDSISENEIKNHKESELIMHLISAHHGWARPCFRPNAGNNGEDDISLIDSELLHTLSRYANLQKRFGVWGLAWLEGLVRGSDWSASS